MTKRTHFSTLHVSRHDEEFSPDKLSKGALSRLLESDKLRLRIMVYPAGFEADHTCYAGHALYVISGKINTKLGEEIAEWEAGDAFIIPDDTPHVMYNPFDEDAKLVIVD